jgi:DNA-binding MarR family transcriptional regulator
MQVIRGHMRRHRSGLTVPQFRTLYFISVTEGGSLSDVADFIGLSLPAMSRMVDGLVDKRLVLRRTCDSDRRHVRLALTKAGAAALNEARDMAQEQIAASLGKLTPDERAAVSHAMQTLQRLFGPES